MGPRGAGRRSGLAIAASSSGMIWLVEGPQGVESGDGTGSTRRGAGAIISTPMCVGFKRE